jgi:hypothetical protein
MRNKDDILYIYKQKLIKTFASFSNKRCKHMENIHTHVYHAKHFVILYETNAKC